MSEYMRGALLALSLAGVIWYFAHQAYHRGRIDGRFDELRRRMEEFDG